MNNWWHRPRALLSVRALMALILLLGYVLAWVVRRAHVQRNSVAAIERVGGRVRYDWQFKDGRMVSKASLGWPKWLVDHLGIDHFSNVTMVDFPDRGSDAEMVALGRLTQVDTLILDPSGTTGVGLAQLDAMSSLRWLTMSRFDGLTGARVIPPMTLSRLHGLTIDGTGATDEGLKRLAGRKRLELLGLTGTKVTDSGLMHLEGLASLRNLCVDGTQVSDEGLACLSRLPNLKRLSAMGTKVTKSGARQFRQAMPKVSMRR